MLRYWSESRFAIAGGKERSGGLKGLRARLLAIASTVPGPKGADWPAAGAARNNACPATPSEAIPSISSRLPRRLRSEDHTSELQSLMRISYAVFCLKKKNENQNHHKHTQKQMH